MDLDSSSNSLQPFSCPICNKRFTRHENLKRHARLHASERDSSYPCAHCSTTFSRRDLRRRHVKKQHPDVRSRPNSVAPQEDRASEESTWPERGVSITDILAGNADRFGLDMPTTIPTRVDFPPPPVVFDYSNNPRPSRRPSISSPPPSAPLLSPEEISNGVDLFFSHVAHCFPFIHQPTFDSTTVPEALIMGMLSVSLQFNDGPSGLAKACFHRGRQLLESDSIGHKLPSGLDLPAIQACLLLEMHAVLYSGGSETGYGLRLHQRCIELARAGGLAEPIPPSTQNDLDALWRDFVRVESHKRTFFTLYQLDVMWYHVLSIPRTITHLEIKHELPCSSDLWGTTSSAQWAHRKLVGGVTAPLRYIQAVRSCMGPTRTQHDAYGGFLIILFLLSSVREVSGWSTMTGKICFERFEGLHAALKVIEYPTSGELALECESTWHMAMIELLLWSPPHTNGVVEGSLEAALAAGTHLSVSQPIVASAAVLGSLDSHLLFFLAYLHDTTAVVRESPWVTIYCFKAALIGWQLIRAGMGEVTLSMGVTNLREMYEWMRLVFGRRTKWGVGRAVLKALQELEAVSMT